tara:strand:- start:369 stop:614 length:246 start_codon:yes stop_codon:yes gene_type:complete
MNNRMQFVNDFEVSDITRLNYSRNGNPKFLFSFKNGMEMETPTDAGWVYAISPNAIIGTVIRLKYKTTNKRSGRYEILGIA